MLNILFNAEFPFNIFESVNAIFPEDTACSSGSVVPLTFTVNDFAVDLTPLEIVAVKVAAASELCLETEPDAETIAGLLDNQLIDAPSRPFVVKLRFAVT